MVSENFFCLPKTTKNIDEFFLGPLWTALNENEILTEIKIPIQEKRTGGCYIKLERKVGDYATAGVAVNITLDDSGTCTEAGIGLTNVNPTPLKAERSEQALIGTKLDDAAIENAAQYASEDCNPSDDLRGSVDYKRRIVKVLTKRMIIKAMERAN